MYEQLRSLGGRLSHAYVLVGDSESIFGDLERWHRDDLGVSFGGNPNVIVKRVNRFSVADARELTQQQSKTGVGETGEKIFVLMFDSITVEAQNALLKTIEEPTEGTRYFFIVPTLQVLIPTVLSRVQVLHHDIDSEKIGFLYMSILEREKYVAQYYGDSKKDIPADRAGAYQFVGGVLHEIREHKSEIDSWTSIYREIEGLQQYTLDRSSSIKYICEYLTTTLPISSPPRTNNGEV